MDMFVIDNANAPVLVIEIGETFETVNEEAETLLIENGFYWSHDYVTACGTHEDVWMRKLPNGRFRRVTVVWL